MLLSIIGRYQNESDSYKVITQMGYRLLSFHGRPVIALPASSKRLKHSALQRCQPNTIKKEILRGVLHLIIATGLDAFFLKPVDAKLHDAVGFDFSSWLNHIRDLLGESDLAACVILPPEQGRGRIYVHLFRPDGCALAFSKISLTKDSDYRLLVETEALKLLSKLGHKRYHTPFVLGEGTFNNHRYIVVEAIPGSAKPFRANHEQFPSEAVHEYAMPIRLGSTSQIRSSDWWQRFCAMIDHKTTFFKEACATVEKGRIQICRVNGDLGPANMMKSDDRLWILDWEQSCPDGPLLTDLVSFYLGSNRRRVLKNTRRLLQELFEMLTEIPYIASREDILMALVFLHGANFTLASKLIDIWPEDRL